MVKFSVIIPTRQRHETLPFAIKTVLNQSFDNYELIICDNCSTPETEAVVKAIDSPKIKFIRSEVPLAMHENWELAVSKAEGEFVILFGDDDGLVPHSLELLNKLITLTSFSVIAWNRAYYNWPNILPEIYANRLQIPLNDPSSQVVDASLLIKGILEAKLPYTLLPMLYNSAINRKLILELKQKTGRIFSSITPDIYSGFAFANLSSKFLYLNLPLSINGGSNKSNGTAYFYNVNCAVINDFIALNDKSELRFHSCIPHIRSIHAAIVEPFYQLQERLPALGIDFNEELVFREIVKGIRAYTIDEWDHSVNKIKIALKGKEHILNKLKLEGLFSVRLETNEAHDNLHITGLHNGFLNIDASQFGLKDVYDVALFCDKIVSLKYVEEKKLYPPNELKSAIMPRIKRRIIKSINELFLKK